jgi:hypothetical protein
MDNHAGRVPPLTRSRFLLHIVFASTNGHTEYVVDALIDSLNDIAPGWEIEKTMAEKTQPQERSVRTRKLCSHTKCDALRDIPSCIPGGLRIARINASKPAA